LYLNTKGGRVLVSMMRLTDVQMPKKKKARVTAFVRNMPCQGHLLIAIASARNSHDAIHAVLWVPRDPQLGTESLGGLCSKSRGKKSRAD